MYKIFKFYILRFLLILVISSSKELVAVPTVDTVATVSISDVIPTQMTIDFNVTSANAKSCYYAHQAGADATMTAGTSYTIFDVNDDDDISSDVVKTNATTVALVGITNIVIPISSKSNPASASSSITIQGVGFVNGGEILLNTTNTTTVKEANVTNASNTGIIFTAPSVSGNQTIIYRINGEEQILGEMYFTLSNVELEKFSDWGLVAPIGDKISNNRNYEWYISQGSTGIYSRNNCGPAATTMMLKWKDNNFNKTTEDARAAYRPNGGNWTTYDITDYISDNGKTSTTYQFNSVTDLKNVIDGGGIAILCPAIFYVIETDNRDHRIHKFYKTNKPEAGHFIIVKGYIYSKNKIFFEVYDPGGSGSKYKYRLFKGKDRQFKGEDRYYLGSCLFTATQMRWNSMITMFPDPSKLTKSNKLAISTLKRSRIRPQSGK